MDVTDRRLAAMTLATSEARLRLAVDAAEMGVFEFDPQTQTTIWSERMWQLRGLVPEPGSLTLDRVIELVHSEDRSLFARWLASLTEASDGTRSDLAFRSVHSDGTIRHLEARVIAQHGASGTGVRIFGVNIDVSERYRAAQALEKSEARLRLAIDIANLAIFEIQMPEDTGYWSERMWHIRGWEPRPGLPTTEEALAIVHPDDRDWLSRHGRSLTLGAPHGEVQRMQYRLLLADGTVRHIAAATVVLHGPSDGSWTYTGINIDITKQVEREQVVRETAARFELAIDAARLAVWDWNSATGRLSWSPRMWEFFGVRPRTTVLSERLRSRFVHAEDRNNTPSAWLRRSSAEPSSRGENSFRITRLDGSVRYLHWQGIPLRDDQGKAVRFTGVVADITEAKKAELAIRTSEQVFRMASEAAEQGVWTHDFASDKITWTSRMWRIHGMPQVGDAPSHAARIAMIHPEDRAEVLSLQQDLKAAAKHATHCSYRILRPDGATRTVECNAMLVMGADDRPERIVGVITDVTEARELTAQAMVADKLATLGEMAGAIAHELAQPLQAVMATAATSRMRLLNGVDAASVARVGDSLGWIERQIARVGKTIQHLLAFSRGESSCGVTRLADAVEGAMELIGRGLRNAGIEVTLDLKEDLPPVRGGQIEIEQVMVNLLTNARDAMVGRSLQKIRITGREDGVSVMLDVTDTGGGVPADRMDRIFEPFYTTKAVGRGTGIGLTVVRRTMGAIRGTISVANTSEGACFTLTFMSAVAE